MMKNNGIGRPSTRANIIETLFRRNYIERKKKNLHATSTGIQLIDVISDELLKSPELTGEWESKLRKIEMGTYDAATFKDELIEMVTNLTKTVINEKPKVINFQQDIKPEITATPRKRSEIILEETLCPKCKKNNLIKGKTAVGCSNFKDCGFKTPFEIFGKKLTEKQILDLILKGRSSKLKGFTDHSENISEGSLVLNDDLEVDLKN